MDEQTDPAIEGEKGIRQAIRIRSLFLAPEAGSEMPQWAVMGWPGHIGNLFGGVVTNRENKIETGNFRS